MVDTGATYSCIGKEGAGLPLSTSKIQTVGFSGKTQIIPHNTASVPMTVAGTTVYAPVILSRHPNQPSGKRHLLKAKIMCTPGGVCCDVKEPSEETMMTLRVLQTLPQEQQPREEA